MMDLGLGRSMRRREFITSLVSTITAWPFSGLAQTASKVYRIGVLSRDASYVAAWPRQTFDQTRCNGIASRFGYHNWNGCRGILGSDGCRTAKGQDHVYVARHEILGKLRQLFPVVPAGTHFERHIAIGRVAVTH